MKEIKARIEQYPWDNNGYKPEVEFTLNLAKDGFCMHIVVMESDPLREKTQHFQPVHEDSCVEWFVNFAPQMCDRYFNFEVNANGCMNVAFKRNRYESTKMTVEDIESMKIKTQIYTDKWEVDYTIPFTLIQKYIPEYQYEEGMMIKTNFYKCGDWTKFPHYGMWNPSDLEKPDFHRPEYFKEMILD